MKVQNVPMLAATTVTSTQTTAWFPFGDATTYSISCVVTSTLSGTVRVQTSDEIATPNGVDLSADTAIALASCPVIFRSSKAPEPLYRVIFTYSAGSGDLTITANLKSPGA